ncbi:CCR4-NOT transcription complex subunit 4 [Apostasia shenzhenica]|uniref:CCR4-NOT transcription complex subunit 4 n=1 Tax=Apostasia shenzhenica TaxID=1088818 RepID=A0A2I0A5K8_9ASPA|nr:CCR4-NOT transcription complex subunit 4 [Apostasia shenzhenica]
MGYDAMANDVSAPAISRDLGKKKRANRSAKLKQCKLDARREQWLSQVKNSGGKDGSMGISPALPSPHRTMSLLRHSQAVLERKSLEREVNVGSGLDGSDSDSPAHSPIPIANMHRKGSSSTSASSGCSIGLCSRSVSDAEEDREEEGKGEEKGGVDDWEAVADALSAVVDHTQDKSDSVEKEVCSKKDEDHQNISRGAFRVSEPEPNRIVHRAWRADDASRPQCLPNLSKQRSFPVNMERRFAPSASVHTGILSVPSSCPICVEDFDVTDSSFLPCCCGFRICLFCHKKILEEGDGRCPGCRKQYDRVPCMENGISGVALSFPCRFSRSFSMSLRS